MKPITMRDFRWLGVPAVWEKDYRKVTCVVEPHMDLPDGPLLVAVSDENFLFEATIQTPACGGFAGLCVYHLDTNYAAVGLNQQELEIVTCINSHQNRSHIPFSTTDVEMRWYLKRQASKVHIGLGIGEENQVVWISCFDLPGIYQSLSFGPYFSNTTNKTMEGRMHSIRYTRAE